MRCPFCQADDTKVTDSRLVVETNAVKRRRGCDVCNERFTTYETIELIMPRVIKRDESREAFDEQKLRHGLLLALEKRPVNAQDIDAAVASVLHQMHASGEKEVSSHFIGELVMKELKKLDDVAYVRFASVYRRFKDLDAFREAIEKIVKD